MTTLLAISLPVQPRADFDKIRAFSRALLFNENSFIKAASDGSSFTDRLKEIAVHIHNMFSKPEGSAFRKAYERVWLRKVKQIPMVNQLIKDILAQQEDQKEKNLLQLFFSPIYATSVGEAENHFDARKELLRELAGERLHLVKGNPLYRALKDSIVVIGTREKAISDITKALRQTLSSKGLFQHKDGNIRSLAVEVLQNAFMYPIRKRFFFNPLNFTLSYSTKSAKDFASLKTTVVNFSLLALKDLNSEYAAAIKENSPDRLIKPNFLKLREDIKLDKFEELFIKEVLGLNKIRRSREVASDLFDQSLKHVILNLPEKIKEFYKSEEDEKPTLSRAFTAIGLSQQSFSATGKKVYHLFLELLRGQELNEAEKKYLESYKGLSDFLKNIQGLSSEEVDTSLATILSELENYNAQDVVRIEEERSSILQDLTSLNTQKNQIMGDLSEIVDTLEDSGEKEFTARLKPLKKNNKLFKLELEPTEATEKMEIVAINNKTNGKELKYNLPSPDSTGTLNLEPYKDISNSDKLEAVVVFKELGVTKRVSLVSLFSNSGIFRISRNTTDLEEGLLTAFPKSIIDLNTEESFSADKVKINGAKADLSAYPNLVTREDLQLRYTAVHDSEEIVSRIKELYSQYAGVKTLRSLRFVRKNIDLFKERLIKLSDESGKIEAALSALSSLDSLMKAILTKENDLDSLARSAGKSLENFRLKSEDSSEKMLTKLSPEKKKLYDTYLSGFIQSGDVHIEYRAFEDNLERAEVGQSFSKAFTSADQTIGEDELSILDTLASESVDLDYFSSDTSHIKKLRSATKNSQEIAFLNLVENSSKSNPYLSDNQIEIFAASSGIALDRALEIRDELEELRASSENAYVKAFQKILTDENEKLFIDLLIKSLKQHKLVTEKEIKSFSSEAGLAPNKAYSLMEKLEEFRLSYVQERQKDFETVEESILSNIKRNVRFGTIASLWAEAKLKASASVKSEESDIDLLVSLGGKKSDISKVKAAVIEGVLYTACEKSLESDLSVKDTLKELQDILAPFTGNRGIDEKDGIISNLFPDVMGNRSKLKEIYSAINPNAKYFIQDIYLDKQAILAGKDEDSAYLEDLMKFGKALKTALKNNSENIGTAKSEAALAKEQLSKELHEAEENLKKVLDKKQKELGLTEKDLELAVEYSVFNLVVDFYKKLDLGTKVSIEFQVPISAVKTAEKTETKRLEITLLKPESRVYFPCPEKIRSSLHNIKVYLNDELRSPYEVDLTPEEKDQDFTHEFKVYLNKLVKEKNTLTEELRASQPDYDKAMLKLGESRKALDPLSNIMSVVGKTKKKKELLQSLFKSYAKRYMAKGKTDGSDISSLPEAASFKIPEEKGFVLTDLKNFFDQTVQSLDLSSAEPKNIDKILDSVKIDVLIETQSKHLEAEIESIKNDEKVQEHNKKQSELNLAESALAAPRKVVGFKEKMLDEKTKRENYRLAREAFNNLYRAFLSSQGKLKKDLDKVRYSFIEQTPFSSSFDFTSLHEEEGEKGVQDYYDQVRESLEYVSKTYSVIQVEKALPLVRKELEQLKKEHRQAVKDEAKDSPIIQNYALAIKSKEREEQKLLQRKEKLRESAPYKEKEEYKKHLEFLFGLLEDPDKMSEKLIALKSKIESAKKSYSPELISEMRKVVNAFNAADSYAGQIELISSRVEKRITSEIAKGDSADVSAINKSLETLRNDIEDLNKNDSMSKVEAELLNALISKAEALKEWSKAKEELNKYEEFRYLPISKDNLKNKSTHLKDNLIANMQSEKERLSAKIYDLEERLKKASLFSAIAERSPEKTASFNVHLVKASKESWERDLTQAKLELESVTENLLSYEAEKSYLEGKRKRFYIISLTGEVNDFDQGMLFENGKDGTSLREKLKKTRTYREFSLAAESTLTPLRDKISKSESLIQNLSKLAGTAEGDFNVETLSAVLKSPDSLISRGVKEYLKRVYPSVSGDQLLLKALILLKRYPSTEALSQIEQEAGALLTRNSFTRRRVYSERTTAEEVSDTAVEITDKLLKGIKKEKPFKNYSTVISGENKSYNQVVSEELTEVSRLLKSYLEDIDPSFSELSSLNKAVVREISFGLDPSKRKAVEDVLKKYEKFYKGEDLSVDKIAYEKSLLKDKSGNFYREESLKLDTMLNALKLNPSGRAALNARVEELRKEIGGDKSLSPEQLKTMINKNTKELDKLENSTEFEKEKIEQLELKKEVLLKSTDAAKELALLEENLELSRLSSKFKNNLSKLMRSDRVNKTRSAEKLIGNFSSWIADNMLSKTDSGKSKDLALKLKEFFYSSVEEIEKLKETDSSLIRDLKESFAQLTKAYGGKQEHLLAGLKTPGLSEDTQTANLELSLKESLDKLRATGKSDVEIGNLLGKSLFAYNKEKTPEENKAQQQISLKKGLAYVELANLKFKDVTLPSEAQEVEEVVTVNPEEVISQTVENLNKYLRSIAAYNNPKDIADRLWKRSYPKFPKGNVPETLNGLDPENKEKLLSEATRLKEREDLRSISGTSSTTLEQIQSDLLLKLQRDIKLRYNGFVISVRKKYDKEKKEALKQAKILVETLRENPSLVKEEYLELLKQLEKKQLL